MNWLLFLASVACAILAPEIIAIALEHIVLADRDLDQQIARRRTLRTGLALAC